MPKKTSKGSGDRGRARRKPSKTRDLPVGHKAKTVKGGAFSAQAADGSVRNTVGGVANTVGGIRYTVGGASGTRQ